MRPVPSFLLFVYGSLKRDGQHHAELAGARFVGEALTAPGYALTRLGPYRALVAAAAAAGDGGGQQVAGELFEVGEARLAELDDFEGSAYVRGVVALSGAHSRCFAEALAYFAKAR